VLYAQNATAHFTKLTDKLAEHIKVVKIDVDQNQMITARLQIQSVSTLMLFKNGQVIHKQAGVHSKAQL
jgi:thioredoxin 1